jgi:two-component system response regulator AtoC
LPFKILVVDNEAEDLEVTKMILSGEPDFEVVAMCDADQAIAHVRQKPNQFSAILLDYHMPKDGLTTAQEMFAINPDLQISILSADQTREALKKSIAIGVCNFIDKDEDSDALIGIVRSLCQKWNNRNEVFSYLAPQSTPDQNEKTIRSFGLIGRSQKLVNVCNMIQQAAKVECNVMIRGESGSGKELIARAIHAHSKRKSGPFVAINVAALNENLAESELFGHVKGAFTGAIDNSPGKFLSAQSGTLFLDEIGDLKPEIQVKLLRVLQERKLSPVGSTKVVSLDVRVITATHVNLEKAITEGNFREDLYYRLNVFPIFNPTLRERPEDIQPLIQHFLNVYKSNDRQFLMKTVRVLERYGWPGNIRELENEIQKVLTYEVNKFDISHLSRKILDSLDCRLDETPSHTEYQRKLWKLELDYIEQNVKHAGSLREACRSIFKSPVSSIHTRLNSLKDNLTKHSKTLGVENEQVI